MGGGICRESEMQKILLAVLGAALVGSGALATGPASKPAKGKRVCRTELRSARGWPNSYLQNGGRMGRAAPGSRARTSPKFSNAGGRN